MNLGRFETEGITPFDSGTILLVENDDGISCLKRLVLEQLEYRVTRIITHREALEYSQITGPLFSFEAPCSLRCTIHKLHENSQIVQIINHNRERHRTVRRQCAGIKYGRIKLYLLGFSTLELASGINRRYSPFTTTAPKD